VGVPPGFTDADRGFSFGSGTNPTAKKDVQNTLGANPFASGFQDMNGCELRAAATGFSSDVGTIVLHRLEGVHGSVFSTATLLAKKEARKAYEKGGDRTRKEDYDEAMREYEKAVRAAPRFAAAWYESRRQARLDAIRRTGLMELPARQTHERRRVGASLYAALEVASGTMVGPCRS
jgi:hypothetical protein